MRPRLLAKLWILALPIIVAACSKRQKPVSVTPARVVSEAPTASAPAVGSLQNGPRFTGEVRQGQQFEKAFAPNMVFRLEPYAGNDSGWSIRIAPGTDSAASSMDCIGAIQVPLHGDTTLEIEPPEDGASKDPSWKQRAFDFVATAEDCKVAWGLMNDANYNHTLSEKEREQAGARQEKLPLHHGKFTILDARYGPANATNGHGTLEWLKFEVDLNAGAEASSAQAPKLAVQPSGTRAIDVRPL